MISVIFSLIILVMHVTKIHCILSSPNLTCFRYKEIITIWIITIGICMVGTICWAEIVMIPKYFSLCSKTRVYICFNSSFLDYDNA